MQTNLSVAARRLTAPVLAGALLILSACGGGGSGGASNGGGGGGGTIVDPGSATPVVTTAVAMQNIAFTPPSIQVSPGATVTFTNNDVGTAHNVTFAAGSAPNIGDFSSGSKTTTAPSTPGTYTYQCTNHAGMSGVIKVQ
jgi:plastocyanin